MTFLHLAFYLLSCLLILGPLYAASAIAFKPAGGEPAMVSAAPAPVAKNPKEHPKLVSDGEKRPVWIAATREYKISPAANAAANAYAQQIPENKEAKKRKRITTEKKRPEAPALSTFSYAQETHSASPFFQRD